MFAYRGVLRYTNKISGVVRIGPFFSSCKYLEGVLNWGLTLFLVEK